MQPKAQGLLASLLMFIPLLAVPFVASFGVPWLQAKAKDEGLALPDMAGPLRLEPGVGQSKSGRHSADDLFAPVLKTAAVDLRMAQGSQAQVQNPHLRNASLVVSHNESWVDPFESIQAIPSQGQNVPADFASSDPQNPLGGWTLKEESGEFGPNDAPAPRDSLETPANGPEPNVSKNPFAELESEASFASKTPETQVAVADNAFEDPVASSRVNRDPNAFDASRPLFIQDEKTEPPAETRQARMQEPSAQPAKVAANSGNNLHESQRPLTWETARVRLNELGIKDYYVQPHPSGEIFHFRCTYTPPDNPRITRLFEAEAAEPLEAVRKVLGQVENWTERQTASSN